MSLTGLTTSFVLRGLPFSQVTLDGAVLLTVTTNNAAGYLVSVRATDDRLVGATPGNGETIPVDRVAVRDAGELTFSPLSQDTPLIVSRGDGATSLAGDAVSNDYRVDIPFVPDDTYSGTLEYIVSAP